MKLYFVASRTGNETEVEAFTSFIKQQRAFLKKVKVCKGVEDMDCWMFGPLDFTLNKTGILKALEFGKVCGRLTMDDTDRLVENEYTVSVKMDE